MANKTKKGKVGKAVAIGAGVAAAGAAAYALLGPNGKKNRAKVKKFVQKVKETNLPVAEGEFGADMKVHLINDGPVTIMLDTKELLI
jgi:D-Tyr-tRNAtyr deacylase